MYKNHLHVAPLDFVASKEGDLLLASILLMGLSRFSYLGGITLDLVGIDFIAVLNEIGFPDRLEYIPDGQEQPDRQK